MSFTQSIIAAKPSSALPNIWKPLAYQESALQFLLDGDHAALFMRPGLGKTAVTLAYIKRLGTRKTLIVAPLRVCYMVWPGEIKKWDNFRDLKYTILHGPKKGDALKEDSDIYLINPEGLEWFFKNDGIKRLNIKDLIVDESSKFKNSQTRRFKTLKPHLENFEHRTILTGTPTSNGLIDIFGQVFIVDRGATFGTFVTHFRSRYFYPSGYGGYQWKASPGTAEKIAEVIAPFTFTLTEEELVKLPSIVWNPIEVELPPQARQAYKEMEALLLTTFDQGKIEAANAAVAGQKCRQLTGGAVYDAEGNTVVFHDEKEKAVADLVESLYGEPALILYEFEHERERLVELFGKDTPWIGGGVSPKKSTEICERWNAGDIPVLLAQPQSIGYGLNLQGTGQHMVWFTLPWSLEAFDQTIKRLHRQGNPNEKLFIHVLTAKETVDAFVFKALRAKDFTQAKLFKDLLANA